MVSCKNSSFYKFPSHKLNFVVGFWIVTNIYPNIKLYETGLRDDYFGFIFNEIPIDEANLYPQDNPSENTTH